MAEIFDKTIQVLSTSLDGYMLRHNVINDNIANAETPGFKARRVDFEGELLRQMENESSGVQEGLNLSELKPVIYEDPESETGLDRNTVDMEREMAQLSKNEVRYNAATQAISRKFALLKAAIRGGND